MKLVDKVGSSKSSNNVLKIEVKRSFVNRGETFQAGKFYINGKYVCDTLEDVTRGLKDTMTEEEIISKKQSKITAIPSGRYEIRMDVVSDRFSRKDFYRNYANKGRLPRLKYVKGFGIDVLIHCGNTKDNTEGCILVGTYNGNGVLIGSQDAFKKVYPILKEADDNGKRIFIEIY